MKFEIYRSGIIFREWRFRVISSNGRILASSEGYKNHADAEDAVWSIKHTAGSAPVIDRGSQT